MHSHFDKEVGAKIVDKIFDSIDNNGDGHITSMEFFKWRNNFTMKKLRKLFPNYTSKPKLVHQTLGSVEEEEEEDKEDKEEEPLTQVHTVYTV